MEGGLRSCGCEARADDQASAMPHATAVAASIADAAGGAPFGPELRAAFAADAEDEYCVPDDASLLMLVRGVFGRLV